jgi:hypothetical protein
MDTPTPEHPPCGTCRTTDPEAFHSPTSAYCQSCWRGIVDHGRSFDRWARDTLRGSGARFPFHVPRGRE